MPQSAGRRAAIDDGLMWLYDHVDLGSGSDPDSTMVSEPCMIDLDDGRFRMFYEANDSEGRARIMSAVFPWRRTVQQTFVSPPDVIMLTTMEFRLSRNQPRGELKLHAIPAP